jgi:hypothetical protein
MILSVDELKLRVQCSDFDSVIAAKLEAIEMVIRAYTNNNFQNRAIRFSGHSDTFRLYGDTRYFAVGDTIQISASGVNDGLYTVTVVHDDRLEVDGNLFAIDYNLVTKVEYPADVVQCAVDLFNWKQTMGEKVGVKSETLSRHSVTYEDSTALYMGYPVGILNGLLLYRKARC